MTTEEAINTYAEYRAGADYLRKKADACIAYLNGLPNTQRATAFTKADMVLQRLMERNTHTADKLIG